MLKPSIRILERNWVTICFVFLILMPSLGRSENDSLDLTVDVATTTADAGIARRELMDQGAKLAIEQFLKSEFGDDVVVRQKSSVEKQILKDFSRFAPSSRHMDFAPQFPSGFKSTVLVKLNRSDLLKRSFEVGLRRPSELEPILLPLWIWVDEVRPTTFAWWVPALGTDSLWLSSLAQHWEASASSAFDKQGLQFLRPINAKYGAAVPETHRKLKLEPSDVEALSKQWKAPMSLTGFTRIAPLVNFPDRYLIEVRWVVTFIRNGRVVAELERKVETEAGGYPAIIEREMKKLRESLFAELADQVGGTRRKGTLQAETIQIEFQGSLGPAQRETLRAVLSQKFRGIKEVREIEISANKTVYDVEVVESLEQLAKEMPDLPLSHALVRLEKVEGSRFIFRVSRKGE